MSYNPALAIQAGVRDVGKSTNSARCNEFTDWQTRGQVRCAPYCASALCMWSAEAGYAFDPNDGHVWGDRGDWNVTNMRVWAQNNGLWRPKTQQARAGWGVVLNFTMWDQHIGMVAAQGASMAPVATIEGNTGGGRVLAKTRYMPNVGGFIAFDEAGQTGPGTTPKPPEVKVMGMAASCIVPGAHIQGGGAHKGRWPSVSAFSGANGWDIVGANGTILKGDKPALGMSFVHLGKLNKPIVSIEPIVDKEGKWAGKIVATAEDFGTFEVTVEKINYT